MSAKIQEVIVATRTRGNGYSDPIREITEVFEKDGTRIAERDPHLECRFVRWQDIEYSKPSVLDGFYLVSIKAKNDQSGKIQPFIKILPWSGLGRFILPADLSGESYKITHWSELPDGPKTERFNED